MRGSSKITFSYNELPPPPPGKTGWPWTTFPHEMETPEKEPDVWPKITIVTPSFNQADFLEETIRSVLLQGYPNVEYLIMDGGSTDGSVEIIRKYERWLTDWVSHKDQGQASAINSGFRQGTGEWLAWLNSDDCYAPGALFTVARKVRENSYDFLLGKSLRFHHGCFSTPVCVSPIPEILEFKHLRRLMYFDQPACFWHRDLFERIGRLEESFTYCFDWIFFLECAKIYRPVFIDKLLAFYRWHSSHKTGMGKDKRIKEILAVYDRYLSKEDHKALEKIRFFIPFLQFLYDKNRRPPHNNLWASLMNWAQKALLDSTQALHPHICFMLGLPCKATPFPQVEKQEKACWGSVSVLAEQFAWPAEPAVSKDG